MDSFNELGKNLNKTNKNTNAGLKRDHIITPSIEHTRDIFDWVIPFEMDFYIPETTGVVNLDLQFSLPPEICCANCICVACEKYNNIATNVIITTEYPFVSVYIIANYISSTDGQVILYEGSGWFTTPDNQTIHITGWTSLYETSIKVCYTYLIEGCT